MASSSADSADLSDLQRQVLHAFFARERGFVLTGGAALVGFHLHHRFTDDLDLFAYDDNAFERGRAVLNDLSQELQLTVVIVQDAPGFKRFVLTRGTEAVVVDLVREYVSQAFPDILHDGIRVDAPEEILINKITTIVSRAEERDLVDLLVLERAGLRIEDSLAAAMAKDGGCTPATLAWVLSQVDVKDDAKLPAGIAAPMLRAFIAALIQRLRKAALPEGHD